MGTKWRSINFTIAPTGLVWATPSHSRRSCTRPTPMLIEPPDLWTNELPEKLRRKFLEVAGDLGRRAEHRPDLPVFGGNRPDDVQHPGGTDKHRRLAAMDADGVQMEILYGTWGLKLLAIDDPELEAACVEVYNDWLIDFCSVAPDRLVGLAVLSCYDIDGAIAEMSRCADAGMRGVCIWQIPRADLRFNTDHYDRLWAAAQEMELPVSLHILSGHGYRKHPDMLSSTNDIAKKLAVCTDAMHDIIFSGVLERHPRLQVVTAENEIGWLPWVLEQWDFYVRKERHHFGYEQEDLKLLPSEYFERQMHATFFNDAVGARALSWWGQDNCMWSSDFPHSNTTWPRSRELLANDLGAIPQEIVAKIVHGNCARLYNLPMPEPWN